MADLSKKKGHKTLGNKLISCLDPYQRIEGILSKAGFTGFYAFFLKPDHPGESPFPAQSCTALCHCFRFKSGRGSSQEIRRLLADRMRTQAISKPRGEGPSPPFL